ncbi:hypothetical protein BU24DRAFT_129893 [Aaosphaeria arxii CBS 175.79]|uniref:Zn(2)-C6 fungal-type domain-containing protein n=1 Tax=Aaosphaeria arxii CBS 175.79 TaxID=1450172 RepID=A0A6A5Y3A7_9PLEO|nr:uncharacterized protein BU24DRAFT_129893 [Aaosphaeria arxii CBS 175.79]KAF2019938.1 hypothetical protein BU24DRAFT_129893 [Aaosphaeria arxii CBS 175.79]
MASPSSQQPRDATTTTATAQCKVPIPRLNNRRRPSDNNAAAAVEKPRAARACLGCRQLKMKCSGEVRCQRCAAGGKPCVYPQARKERIRSVADQNEHMLRLMRDLRGRVAEDDRLQIEELLERIGAVPRKRQKESNQTSTSQQIASSPVTVVDASGDASVTSPNSSDAPSAVEFAGKLSNLQCLQSRPPQDQLQQISSEEIQPQTAVPFDSTHPAQQVFKPQLDNASLLETFWCLQRDSGSEQAQDFLKYVKTCDVLDSSSVETWLGNQQKQQRIDSPYSTLLSTSSSPRDRVSGYGKEADELSNSQTETPDVELADAQFMSRNVTVTTIRRAVDMFFSSTGLLFYIVPKDQQESLFRSALSRDDGPMPLDSPFVDLLRNSTGLEAKARLAEISGMAAIGLLYLRIADEEHAPPEKMAHYFYSIAKQMLDSAVEANPLRAMKVCALLTLYNIYVKARVAMAYVELGLGLAQLHGLNDKNHETMGADELLDYRRTWRTLLTFNGWLAASLGYTSGQLSPSTLLMMMEQDATEEDIIQQELAKVTIIKARIIRAIPDDGIVDDSVIDSYRLELHDLNERLPEWMTMKRLISKQDSTPVRKGTFYFHLFFLSAMQLLHRRSMANPTSCSSPARHSTRTGVREGLMAAKMAARMLALMAQETYIGQFCWMCIYSSYTSGIIILHAAVQKILTGYHSSTWIADLTLANICVNVLAFCAEVDSVAARMRDIVKRYMEVITAAVNAGQLNADPGENNNEDEVVDYLFSIPDGDTRLHKAARDLLRLIQYPFGTALELIPQGGPRAPPVRSELVNWMEAAVGIPQELDWELRKCGLKMRDQPAGTAAAAAAKGTAGQERGMRGVMATMGQGHCVPMGDSPPWTTWTSQSFGGDAPASLSGFDV